MIQESIEAATRLFGQIPFRRILSNGRMELVLKSMLAVGWESLGTTHRTVMDKTFNGKLIDVMALDRGLPKFWIEAKCDFAEKRAEALARATKTVAQIRRYQVALRNPAWCELADVGVRIEVQEFRTVLLTCPSYVVHFLNHVPTALPEFIRRKHDNGVDAIGRTVTPAQLINHYVSQNCEELANTIFWHDPLDAMATVEAIVMNVPHIDMRV